MNSFRICCVQNVFDLCELVHVVVHHLQKVLMLYDVIYVAILTLYCFIKHNAQWMIHVNVKQGDNEDQFWTRWIAFIQKTKVECLEMGTLWI